MSSSASPIWRYAIAFTAIVALSATLAPRAASQGMVSAGATAQPLRPLPAGMKAPTIDYRDLAPAAGLTAVNVSGNPAHKDYIVEDTGNGLAIFDYDNDGLPDIFLNTADRLDGVGPRPTVHLYHNLGGLKFEDVTAKAGLGHLGWGQGVCAADFDEDGYVDLFVTQWGQNVLLHNMGNGTFRDETKERGLTHPGTRWSTGCAFLDYDRDGHLDLFVSNYIEFNQAKTPKPGESKACTWKNIPVTCGPMGLPGETMTLYHNDGHGHFQDVSKEAGVEVPKKYYGLTVLTGDFDNDGWPDVYVASDSTPSLFFHNQRNGTFKETGVFAGVAYNQDGQEQAGMGASAADYDGDGLLDIIKTNFSNDVPTLYRNTGDAGFNDVTVPTGLAVETQFVRWGVAFVDIDNDGWKDVFMVNGHVYPGIAAVPGERWMQPRSVYWNRGDGEFFLISSQAGPAIQVPHTSRGLAVADLDNDGSMELVAINMHEGPSLFKNFGTEGNSLLVRALTATGRDAIGARITVTAAGRKRIDEVRSGGYYISQGDFRVHFGLAAETKADVAVRWPDGKIDNFPAVDANQWITIRQGKGIISQKKFAK